MATTLTINGQNYSWPALGDTDYSTNILAWCQAVSSGLLQKSGGNFTLTSDVNFGASYGVISKYYKSVSSDIATAGIVRLASSDTIGFRNNANDADILLEKDTSDNLKYNSKKVLLSTDVVNADINASAAIAWSKMANLTASRALVSNGDGDVSASDVTSTELGYLDGVTSAIQTQLNAKIESVSNTNVDSDAAIELSKLEALTADRAVITDGSGELSVSDVTATELGYLDGVTSSIQTQLNAAILESANNTFTGDNEFQGDLIVRGIGDNALDSLTTGTDNTAHGTNALTACTEGIRNTAMGADALAANTTADNNTAMGDSALENNTTGDENTAVGRAALFSNQAGKYNVAIGVGALLSSNGADYGTAAGHQALTSNTTGDGNTALGRKALFANTTGSYNTAIGEECFTTGTAYTNTTCVGFGASADASNQINLGNGSVTEANIQVSWTVTSDERDKAEIYTLDKGLDFVKALRPVEYKFRLNRDTEETTGDRRYGFIAQEVLALEGEDNVIVKNRNPEKLRMTSDYIVPIITKAMQELNTKHEEATAAKDQQIAQLIARIEALENKE